MQDRPAAGDGPPTATGQVLWLQASLREEESCSLAIHRFTSESLLRSQGRSRLVISSRSRGETE